MVNKSYQSHFADEENKARNKKVLFQEMVSHDLLLSKDFNHKQFPAPLRILLPLHQSALLKMLAIEDYRCLISIWILGLHPIPMN